jgi:hypothetical protein
MKRVEARPARVGDWIEEPDTAGGAPRTGLVLEVLGDPDHPHYRVRWDEEHEAVHFPSPRARLLEIPHR